jgi:N-ethylmaleimide reductase
MGDSTPLETFGHVARELGKRGIAFICAREAIGADRLGPRTRPATRSGPVTGTNDIADMLFL